MFNQLTQMKELQKQLDQERREMESSITEVLEYNMLKVIDINLSGESVKVYCPQGILSDGQPFTIDLTSPEWHALVMAFNFCSEEKAS